MVMGNDSCSKGRGFKSHCHILDGHFFTLTWCKHSIDCLKRSKINEKEAGVGPFLRNLDVIAAGIKLTKRFTKRVRLCLASFSKMLQSYFQLIFSVFSYQIK